MVDDHCLRAALGLTALTWVVHDEGIQVRQRAQNGIGPAGRAQRHALARQPFQVAVLANVHHRVHRKGTTQPEVKGEVAVRGHQVGVMVSGHQIQIATACGLYAHEHLAQAQA